MNSQAQLQDEIRKTTLAKLRSIARQDRSRLSMTTCGRLLEVVAGRDLRAVKVALYRSMDPELSLQHVEEGLFRIGAELHYPRITGDTMDMVLVENPFRPDTWVNGERGTLVPQAGPQVDPAELAWIIVPGVAFSPAGDRIGRGAGYYDRFLKQCPQAFKTALAFDEQVVAEIPVQPWDQKLGWILTPTRDMRVVNEGSLFW